MIITRCLICGRKARTKELYPATFSKTDLTAATYSARRLPDKVHYRLVRCSRCGLIFSNPVLPHRKIAALYTKAKNTYNDIQKFVTATYIRLMERHRLYLPSSPTILEIGCGNGFFLDAVRTRFGWTKLFGVEPGMDMVNAAPAYLKGKIITDLFREGLFAKDSIDCVACFHTLDHMPDPFGALKESFRILSPGGIMIIVTHDTENFSVKLMGEKSPIFDIEHIYLFSRKNLTQLASMVGFSVITSESLVNTYPLWYWVRMAGVPAWIKTVCTGILKLFGISQTPFSLAGGNLAMVLRKPVIHAPPPRKTSARKKRKKYTASFSN